MDQNQRIGVVLIGIGLVDAASAMWLPARVPNEHQRAAVRLALLSSGVVLVMLGGIFLSDLFAP